MAKTTHIIAILDRSGSMYGLEVEVISNFNKFLKEQQEVPGKAKLTLAVFDNEYTLIHDKVDLKDVKPITSKEYYLGGATALFDAVGKTMNSLKDKKRAIVFIHTDGAENSSKEFNKSQVKALIDAKPDWQFIFVGADMDAANAGGGIGVNMADIVRTTKSAGDLSKTYDSLVTCSTAYRSGAKMDFVDAFNKE